MSELKFLLEAGIDMQAVKYWNITAFPLLSDSIVEINGSCMRDEAVGVLASVIGCVTYTCVGLRCAAKLARTLERFPSFLAWEGEASTPQYHSRWKLRKPSKGSSGHTARMTSAEKRGLIFTFNTVNSSKPEHQDVSATITLRRGAALVGAWCNLTLYKLNKDKTEGNYWRHIYVKFWCDDIKWRIFIFAHKDVWYLR